MTTTVTMPEVGETVTEGTIERWLKKPGDHVDKYEPIVEINTDKVNVELPSPVSGTLKEILAEEGAVVNVGAELALIEEEAGEVAAEAQTPAPDEAETAEKPVGARSATRAKAPSRGAAHGGSRRATPRVRKLAAELGVDLAQVEGSGPQGRVLEEDVRAFAESGPKAAPRAAPAGPPEQEQEIVPLSAVRRTIAKRMVESKFSAPHAWLAMEADVSGLVALRTAEREAFREREGIDLTYLPFAAAATAQALPEHPYLNASWSDSGVVLKKRIHLGVAVATDEGLLVPVVRDADRVSVAGLARAMADVGARAREGKLRLEDVQGGTFTLDNTGSFGSVLSVPIIAQGQAAILTLEAVQKRPVVTDGDAIAIRSVVYLALSFDHRVLDGAQAGAFLQDVVARLESYGPDSALE